MKGVFFGREQLADNIVGEDWDDDYGRHPGRLRVVYCEAEDEIIPDTNNPHPVGLDGPYDTPEYLARKAALKAAEKHLICPSCGTERRIEPDDPECFAARMRGYPLMVLRCPVAAAWRTPEAAEEHGRLYRNRPTEVVDIDAR